MDDLSDRWVLDVTDGDEPRVFCPLTRDGSVIVGLSVLTDEPPGSVVGVFHMDGDAAVEAWCAAHPDVVREVFG